jgi:membrane protein
MAQTFIQRIKELTDHLKTAVEGKGIERHGDSHLNPWQKFVHFWVLTWKGFAQNRGPVRASALAYTTLLALIPMLAVAASVSTSILKSQGEEPIQKAIDRLVEQLMPKISPGGSGTNKNEPKPSAEIPAPTAAAPASTNVMVAHSEGQGTNSVAVLTEEGKRNLKKALEEVDRQQVVDAIHNSLKRINSGSLGATGMIGLVLVAIMLLSTIETTFNDIWGVTRGRSWLARIIQYWATVTLGPLVPFLVFSVNVGSKLKSVNQWMEAHHLHFVSQLALEQVVPILILCVAFMLFYQLMPNTKVRWQAALLGGLVAGVLWHANSNLNVLYVSKMVTYANIYGSLAMIPIFLVGLYFSWTILLFGAQVAYTYQNRSVYFQQRQAEKVNELGREFASLRIMTYIAQKFNRGERPPTEIEIGQTLSVPTRLVDEILKFLVHAKLALETDGAETAYSVARPLESITCSDILHAVRTGAGNEIDTREEPIRNLLQEQYARIQEAERSVAGHLNLADLVKNVAGSGEPQPRPASLQNQTAPDHARESARPDPKP